MTAPESASRKPRQLDAGSFQPEISSFRLHLAAEGKAAKTVGTYTEAVQGFAGEHLLKQAADRACSCSRTQPAMLITHAQVIAQLSRDMPRP
jgi:hypothetical protein